MASLGFGVAQHLACCLSGSDPASVPSPINKLGIPRPDPMLNTLSPPKPYILCTFGVASASCHPEHSHLLSRGERYLIKDDLKRLLYRLLSSKIRAQISQDKMENLNRVTRHPLPPLQPQLHVLRPHLFFRPHPFLMKTVPLGPKLSFQLAIGPVTEFP